MCGISGFCCLSQNYMDKRPEWEQVLRNMHESLAHRGGDASGIFLRPQAGLSHARLSIRDIEGGAQPMVRTMGHGRREREYAIVYNGEIYNTDELIPDLTRRGFQFRTTCDTEVILYAYMAYGADFVTKLNGIFAFAIWDGGRQQMLLYRDRVGVKPHFYTVQNGTLVFGSEPKALFCHPEVEPELTVEGLREILAIGPARTPGCGVFRGIGEVKPGHYIVYDRRGMKEQRYWDVTTGEHADSYEQTVEKTSFLVRDSITRQMVSDVPVCTFLSGGIDSSIVTAVAAEHMRAHGETLNTFSFDFVGNDVYFQSNAFQPERDLPYVNIMLQRCQTGHTYLECDQSTLVDALYTAVDAKDLPGMTDVDASLLYFCSLVAKHNKVALTGECADEIFGGYPWFYRTELMERDGFPWSADMSARTLFLAEDFAKELELADFSHARYEDTLKKVQYLPGEDGEKRRRRGIAYLNIKWFMQTLLDRMDRTSMYSGLEARVPFADHRIIEYLYNVPWEMKYQNGVEKALLREACADLLPVELLHRKKSPYPKPYHPGYEKLLAERFVAILEDKNAPVAPFLDEKKAREFVAAPKELGKPWFGQLMAGPQLMAYFIQINYWMEKYHLSV
ncbi:MAG: asparagine synthase (glutamine-hydrolyzing) [Roseburia sp.]|nr:asparagine synthase (glutamine-hydrolyzing) [Roseburia sp.]